ncbi:MAG: potassium channel family protein [Psychromonas sp.]
MLPSKRVNKLFRLLARRLSWPILLGLIFTQSAVTYLLLLLAGEVALTNHPYEFIYYNLVVISTVGFGDFSPVSHAGKLVVTFWQIPSGLIVFASFIGKSTQIFIDIARKNMDGSNDFSDLNNHILLLCWDQYSTKQIIELILGDKKRKKRPILLCVTEEMKNPFPDNKEILFARLRTFSDIRELNKIAINKAERIIVDGKSDDETLSIALSIATYASKDANISAHFFDKSQADLLKIHCPQIECSVDTSAKMMVRTMQDPGSSQVTEQLLSTLTGATLYCFQVPVINKQINFGILFHELKANYAIILIGLSHFKNGDDMQLNPESDQIVKTGDYLHYIANERIDVDEIKWNNFK